MSNPRASKVLIVDDDMRNIFALTAVLKTKGFDCVSVQSGAEALKRLEQQRGETAVVLLDMMMPEMDGYETIKKIREAAISPAPIIALTAQAMSGDRERCLAAGAIDYISKPVDVDKLLAILKNYII